MCSPLATNEANLEIKSGVTKQSNAKFSATDVFLRLLLYEFEEKCQRLKKNRDNAIGNEIRSVQDDG